MKNKLSFLYALIFFLVGVGFAVIASYFFGYNLIRLPLQGSDSYNALTYAVWFYKYLPNVPFWFPLQGGGESFILGYPPLYPLSVALLSKLAGLNLFSSMSILNFGTLVLTALGVYFFVFFRLKNKIAALVAVVFFLLSPFPYALVSGGGFLANAYADIFTIFAFIFFDAYLESFLESKNNAKILVNLIFSAVFFALATLAHPVATLGLMVLCAVYFPMVGVLNHGKSGLKKSIVAFVILGFVVFLASWFWFKPFSDYTNFSNRDMAFTADVSTLPPLTFASVLGLVKSDFPLLVNLSIPPVVWMFAIIGTVLSFFKKDKRVFALGVISFISMFLMGTHSFWSFITNISWLLGSFVGHRYYFTTTIILPAIVGSMGVWYLAELPFYKLKNSNSVLSVIKWFGTLALSVVLVYLGIVKFAPLSGFYDKSRPNVLPYGENSYINTLNIWYRPKAGDREMNNDNSEGGGNKIMDWPKIILLDKSVSDTSVIQTARYINPSDPNHVLSESDKRFDLSPVLGGWIKEWDINNLSSMINGYTGQIVLNKSFNSYFVDSFYKRDLDRVPTVLSELAKYFGVNGVLTNPELDQTERFNEVGWRNEILTSNASVRLAPFENSIYEISQKPKVLVIGSAKGGAYEQIFKLSTQGTLSYDKAILFEGGENVDGYSASDLKNYDLLILHGASYKSKSSAYSILNDYLKSGGDVFIETGWQYTAADWGNDNGSPVNMPEIMPVSKTFWNKTEKLSWNGAVLDSNVSPNIDLSQFDPLTWEGLPWSLAYAKTSDLKPQARPILSIGDKVIMAQMQIGSGRVVWSGLNIFGHAVQKSNQGEILLINNIISSVLSDKGDKPFTNFQVDRQPDRLTVTLGQDVPSGSVFLFKENTYPYWNAYVQTTDDKKNIQIHPFGPRFMSIILPDLKSGSKIVFEFSKKGMIGPSVISVLVFAILIVLTIDAALFGNRILRFVTSKFKTSTPGKLTGRDENEDY